MTPAIESAIRAFVESTATPRRVSSPQSSRIPSDNPPGDCDPPAAAVARLLEGLGFAVERHKVPEAVAKAAGMISATNLIVRRRFAAGPTIALNAHGDVVPPGTGWTQDPYGGKIVDGWMYGRGAAVSKSDIAAYAFALLALERSGAALRGAVELHVTFDEEAGGRSDRAISSNTASRSPIWRSAPASPTRSSSPTTAACTWRSRRSAVPRTPPSRPPESTRWRRPTRS